jgi:hypothetical protein
MQKKDDDIVKAQGEYSNLKVFFAKIILIGDHPQKG